MTALGSCNCKKPMDILEVASRWERRRQRECILGPGIDLASYTAATPARELTTNFTGPTNTTNTNASTTTTTTTTTSFEHIDFVLLQVTDY